MHVAGCRVGDQSICFFLVASVYALLQVSNDTCRHKCLFLIADVLMILIADVVVSC